MIRNVQYFYNERVKEGRKEGQSTYNCKQNVSNLRKIYILRGVCLNVSEGMLN